MKFRNDKTENGSKVEDSQDIKWDDGRRIVSLRILADN